MWSSKSHSWHLGRFSVHLHQRADCAAALRPCSRLAAPTFPSQATEILESAVQNGEPGEAGGATKVMLELFVRRVQAGPCRAFFCRCPCDSWGQPLPCKLPSHMAQAALCHMYIPNLDSSRRLRVIEAGQLKLLCEREQSMTGRQHVYGRIFQLRAALQIFQLWKA